MESIWKFSDDALLKKTNSKCFSLVYIGSSPSVICLKRNMSMEYVQDVSVSYLQNKLADCIWLVLENQNKYILLKFHLFCVNELKQKHIKNLKDEIKHKYQI